MSLRWRHQSTVAYFRVGGTKCSSVCMGPLEGGCHYLHYLHSSLALVKEKGGNKPHPSGENWTKDLLSMVPPIRTRPNFPLRQSLPSESFHKPLILHQRAVQFSSVTQSCPTLCNSKNRSKPGLPVHHQLQKFTQTHPSSQ